MIHMPLLTWYTCPSWHDTHAPLATAIRYKIIHSLIWCNTAWHSLVTCGMINHPSQRGMKGMVWTCRIEFAHCSIIVLRYDVMSSPIPLSCPTLPCPALLQCCDNPFTQSLTVTAPATGISAQRSLLLIWSVYCLNSAQDVTSSLFLSLSFPPLSLQMSGMTMSVMGRGSGSRGRGRGRGRRYRDRGGVVLCEDLLVQLECCDPPILLGALREG
jgi:hypothetical protein